MSREKGWSDHLHSERARDLEWMAETGETYERAAERLGITPAALEKWGRDQKQLPLLARLRANGDRLGAGARAGRVAVRL